MPAKDPDRRRATVRAWYARNKQRTAERRRAQRKQRRLMLVAWYAELKSQLVCQRCGEDHPACIQFHHADARTKECTVAEAIRRGFGRDRVLREIAKCTVLCANCHFKLHEQERRHAGA